MSVMPAAESLVRLRAQAIGEHARDRAVNGNRVRANGRRISERIVGADHAQVAIDRSVYGHRVGTARKSDRDVIAQNIIADRCGSVDQHPVVSVASAVLQVILDRAVDR